MPHLPAAAILILMDRPHPDKQEALALAAAVQFTVVALCYHWRDCLSLVVGKHIKAVVCAVDPGEDARDAIEQAGAELVVARETRRRRNINGLAERMYKRGIDTQEISQILQVAVSDVRRSLWKAGLRRRRK